MVSRYYQAVPVLDRCTKLLKILDGFSLLFVRKGMFEDITQHLEQLVARLEAAEVFTKNFCRALLPLPPIDPLARSLCV
jgi:hypothetical protein